jgi:hypothetical protein
MQTVSWAFLAIIVIATAYFISLEFAGAVLIGGIISIVSFWVSHKDVIKLVDSVAVQPSLEDRQAQARQEQKGYLLKFWIRIVIIGVVLLFVIKSGKVNIFGLVLGLSTVVLGITFTALNAVRHYFFRGRR